MTDMRYRHVSIDEKGDLVWAGHDLGPAVGSLMPGASEYEFWRTVRKPDLAALAEALGVPLEQLPQAVGDRFTSDVQLAEFAKAHDIPTHFNSWISTNWDD